MVPQPRGHAEDAKDNLGIDLVAVHVPDPLIGVTGTPYPSPSILVEASFGHLVDAVVLPGNKLSADRTNAADKTHIDPGFCRPVPDRPHKACGPSTPALPPK